jgi:hypothetical protein
MSLEDDVEILIDMAWKEENSNNKTKALKSYNSVLKKLSVCIMY